MNEWLTGKKIGAGIGIGIKRKRDGWRRSMDFGYYNMDCNQGMKQFSDKFFDLAIVDPPYGMDRGKTFGGKDWKMYDRKEWDCETPGDEYFSELFRVSLDQVIFGANYFTKHLPSSMGWVFWDKGQKLTMSDGELIFTSFQKALRRKIMNRCEIYRNTELIHPTQKPVALYRWLLKNYAQPGWKLLDTHVGSASSLIAFEMEGYNDYIGFELDEDYYRDSKNRLETWRKNRHPELFEVSEYRQVVNY